MTVVYPNLVPLYITIGQREQELIIEYPINLPQDLMTLTVLYPETNNEAMARAPTTSLGPRTAKIKLPAFQTYGIYTVVPRFPANQDSQFPPFTIRVLSAVETLINVLAPEEDPYHSTAAQATTAVIAPLLAYLIQNEQQGVQEEVKVVDQVLSQIFPHLDEPIVSLSDYLCGKYANKGETLLHFCVRHQFINTCEVLTQQFDRTSLKKSLEMRGFDGKTPLDISEANENTAMSILLKSASSREESPHHQQHKDHSVPGQGKIKSASSNNLSSIVLLFIMVYFLLCCAKSTEARQIRLDPVLKKIEKYTDNDQAAVDGYTDMDGGGTADLSQPLLKHLKLTALYSAEIIQPYHTVDNEFGTISLKIGDIAYITREEDSHWCTGIVNDRYCRFPRAFLQPLKNNAAGSNSNIPSPEALLESKEIRDLEELETLVDQRKKLIDYAKEKQTQRISNNRLSYLSPVTRSCSVETGLDEISNCSPLLKRSPLPDLPKKTHHGLSLPKPPTADSDDEDSDGEYEPVELGGPPTGRSMTSPTPPAASAPRLPNKLNMRPPISNSTPTPAVPTASTPPSTRRNERQQSPLVNRKGLPQIPVKGGSSVDYSTRQAVMTTPPATAVRQNQPQIPVKGGSNADYSTRQQVLPVKSGSNTDYSTRQQVLPTATHNTAALQKDKPTSTTTSKDTYVSSRSMVTTHGVSPSQLRRESMKITSTTNKPSPQRGRAASDDPATISKTAASMSMKQPQQSQQTRYSTNSEDLEDEGGLSDDEYEDASTYIQRKTSEKSITSIKSTTSADYVNLRFSKQNEDSKQMKDSKQTGGTTSGNDQETSSKTLSPQVSTTSSSSETSIGGTYYSPSGKKKPIPPPVNKKPTLNNIPAKDIPLTTNKTPTTTGATTNPSTPPKTTSAANTKTTPPVHDKPPQVLAKTPKKDTSNGNGYKPSLPPKATSQVKQQASQGGAQSGVQELSKKFEQRQWRY